MLKYILILLIAIIALILTYKPDIFLTHIINKNNLTQKDTIVIKCIALIIAVADFILAMILL